MYKNLRIVFTILSAICLAVSIPLGIFFGYAGWIGALIGAGIFFFIMLLFKQSQETNEEKAKKLKKTTEQGEGEGEIEFTPQKKLPKNATQKPARYRRKK